MPIITDGKDRRMGENSLSTLLLLIKNKFVLKEFKTGSSSVYKTLSDNDLTDELKTKYDEAYEHSQGLHAPNNAQENVVESIKVNGSPLTIENKAVDIPVPLISNDISTDKTSTIKTASPKAVYDYVKSTIAGISSLDYRVLTDNEYDPITHIPTIQGEKGLIYLVPFESGESDAYIEYIFINGRFENIGSTKIDLSGYMLKSDLVEFSAAEVQSIWTSVFSS